MNSLRVRGSSEKVNQSYDAGSGRKLMIHAATAFIALSVNLQALELPDQEALTGLSAAFRNLAYSFHSFTLAHFLLLPGLWVLFAAIARAWEKDGRRTLRPGAGQGAFQASGPAKPGAAVHFPAVIFAAMMVLGWSFSRYNSWSQVLSIGNGQLLKSLTVGTGYYFIFRYLIQYVYLKFAAGFGRAPGLRGKKPRVFAWYEKKLLSAPFLTAALTLAVLYLPYMLVSYPGISYWDTYSQIAMSFPELEYTSSYVDKASLIRPGVYLNAHHPVAHTMLIHVCLVAGKRFFDSWNLGFYMYGILQAGAWICASAWAVRQYVRKYGVTARFVRWLLVYLFAHPVIHQYLFLATKDTFYAAFLMLTVCVWVQVLTEGGKKPLLLLLLFATGTVLFRNEGRYVLLIAAAGSFLLNPKSRKRMAAVFLYTIVFSVVYSRVLLPAAGVTPGSRREMFSIPFQQTARYVAVQGDEVTEEEREAIDAVLKYDLLAKNYKPEIADSVKGTYREAAAAEGLKNYFKTWLAMGLKRPDIYLSAFLNNKYAYFYPDESYLELQTYEMSASGFALINRYTEKIGLALAYPERTLGLRRLADGMSKWLSQYSPFSWISVTSLYPWLTVLCFCYSLRKRDGLMISVSTIPAAVLLMCLAGPTNGNFSRYTYPLILMMPFLFPLLRRIRGPEDGELTENN